jgi:mono/diheme cytochrome c family protein
MLRAPFVVCAILIAGSGVASAAEYESMTGEDLYRRFCAACHGVSGRGDGSVASSFTVEVPDLTLLARRARGVYPHDRVVRIIDGRHVLAAHGSRTMPVWGQEFARAHAAEADADRATQTIVERLAAYVRELQRPAPESSEPNPGR